MKKETQMDSTNDSKDIKEIKLDPALELLHALERSLMFVWQEAANGKYITAKIQVNDDVKGQLEFVIGCAKQAEPMKDKK